MWYVEIDAAPWRLMIDGALPVQRVQQAENGRGGGNGLSGGKDRLGLSGKEAEGKALSPLSPALQPGDLCCGKISLFGGCQPYVETSKPPLKRGGVTAKAPPQAVTEGVQTRQ